MDDMTDRNTKQNAPICSEDVNQHFEEHLNSIKNPHERQSILELTRDIARLPLDQARAALETSATIAGLSLRASIEFLRAAPEAAHVLEAAELRSWGEMGRRIAMGDVESAVSFYVAGVKDLQDAPRESLSLIFQVCSRQLTLSSAVATQTFLMLPALAQAVNNSQSFRSVLEIVSKISRRSAKHSADFLTAPPRVVQSLNRFQSTPAVAQKVFDLAAEFATRAGGIASDA